MDDRDEREIIVEKYRKGRDKLGKDEINAWEDPNFDIYHATDRYGFIHGTRLPDRLPEYETKLKNQENTRLTKWLKMLKSWDQYYPNSEKLKTRTYKGIPNALRGEVWARLLNTNLLKQEQSGKYQEMLEYGLNYSRDVRQIDLDVNRTYRNHIMFRERYNTKQQMLFRVLVAYSVYNAEIGYCQGMSQIAALLLMYMDEEDAFWSMSSLMSDERHAMHGFFIPGFPKLLRFARHHDKVIQKFLPKVSKHFKKFQIDSTLYTLKWFFQCFLDRVPFSLTLRLWDVFLLDGDIILTGMSYTLLKLHKRTLLRKSMEETIEFLQIELEKDFGYHDDSAIQALKQSIDDLRKYKMLSAEKPADNEFPSRPFGILALADSSGFSDNQSIAGSVRFKNDTSSVATSRTSEAGSQSDLKSISIYDNVSLNESIEAAKRLSRLSNYSKKSSEITSPVSQKATRSPQLNSTISSNSEMVTNSDNQTISVIQNEIDHLSSDFDEKLNCTNSKHSQSSRTEKVVVNNNNEKSYMKMTKQYEVIVTQNDSSTKHLASDDNCDIIKDNHFSHKNDNSYSQEVKIEKCETIIIDDQIAVSSSIHKHQTNRTNETNSKLTYISINTSPNTDTGDKSNHNDNQVKIFSHLNNDSIISSQISPSKIRIFVPYKNESKDAIDNSTIPNKDMPVVET